MFRRAEDDNWQQLGLNNYRQNVQGAGVFNAPDLELGLSVSTAKCGLGKLVLQARVANRGDFGVAAGVEVEFFEGDDSSGTLLGTATTAVDLLPGGSTTVDLEVDRPSSGALSVYALADGSAGAVIECNEDNNGNTATGGCPTID